jgi:hypothetical protein
MHSLSWLVEPYVRPGFLPRVGRQASTTEPPAPLSYLFRIVRLQPLRNVVPAMSTTKYSELTIVPDRIPERWYLPSSGARCATGLARGSVHGWSSRSPIE